MLSRLIYPLILSMSLVLTSCDIGGKIDDVTDKLEEATQTTESILLDALDSLERNSSAWQSIVQDTVGKLTEDTQSTVRNELNVILQRGISAAGAEFRCNADFIGRRIKHSIERILARLTGRSISLLTPGICNVVPLAIDRALVPTRLNVVEFYGYDFDQSPLQVTLVNSNGSVNVSTHVDKPTHYHMTLNLGSNGVPLSNKSQRIVIKSGREVLSSISVIQKALPKCKAKDVTYSRSTFMTLNPRREGSGDSEFGGNGPSVYGKAQWVNRGTRVDVQLYMRARETKSDWSTAKGSLTEVYYTPPSGWRISGIVGKTISEKSYTDGDHTEDRFGMGPGGPVKEFIFKGDRKGNDIGVYTGMEVKFNPLVVKLVQTKNCISENELKSMQIIKTINPSLFKNIKISPRK